MDLELAGKIALLAGGAGTIGQAVARVLAAEGAVPVVADLPAFLQCLPPNGSRRIELDVTDPDSVRAAVEKVRDQAGRIDILVVLAGVYQGGPLTSITPQDWDRVLEINLKGTFLITREVLPVMQAAQWGRIVCLASLAGQVGGVVAGANYAASKAGVLALVKSLAKQTRSAGVTVNAINPGPVQGTMTGSWTEAERKLVQEKIPLGRFARPEEIADAIAFLCSPRAGYIHGAHLDINGGVYMD